MTYFYSLPSFFYLSILQFLVHQAIAWEPTNPTKGFISLPFNQSYYQIQKPYNVPEYLMVIVYNGSLMYYRRKVLVPYIYDRWFRLNVIHDVDAAKVKVLVDGIMVLEADARGGKSHTFKCGVYAQNDDSYSMESRWKDIKVLRKCD